MTATHRIRRPVPVVIAAIALVIAACGGATEEPVDEDGLDEGSPSEETEAPDDAEEDDESDEADEADEADEPAEEEPASDQDSGDDEPRTVIESGPGEDCSGQGNRIELAAAPELPDEVAATREFLIDAALRCDEQLLYTAVEESSQFTFSFGDDDDLLGYLWELEEAGDEPFLRLAQVLATTPALTDGGEVYVFPRVATGRAEDTTDEAWDELVWLDDPEAAREQGDGYLDWRAGISPEGEWRFFVRGD